jgi:hypothetical protein
MLDCATYDWLRDLVVYLEAVLISPGRLNTGTGSFAIFVIELARTLQRFVEDILGYEVRRTRECRSRRTGS